MLTIGKIAFAGLMAALAVVAFIFLIWGIAAGMVNYPEATMGSAGAFLFALLWAGIYASIAE